MSCVIVIPARYGSTRFPGKPLTKIAGHTMLKRVWSIAGAVKGVDQVIVSSEDQRILDHAQAFGAKTCLTSEKCKNGSERAYETLSVLGERPDFVINLQGDAVLTAPHIIQALVDFVQSHKTSRLATLCAQIDSARYAELLKSKPAERSGTFVVFDRNHRALYFSRYPIPCQRDGKLVTPIYKHIGIYAFRFDTLEQYIALSPSALEEAEKLEQLRALENGIPIDMVPVELKGRTAWSVDNPEDVKIVEDIIKKEGELVPL